MAVALAHSDRPADAIPVAQRTLLLYRQLCAINPSGYNDHLARGLLLLAGLLYNERRYSEALEFGSEAVDLLRKLYAVKPNLHHKDLIQGLRQAGETLLKTGDEVAASQAFGEAEALSGVAALRDPKA
jgi:hypothetical protein